MKVCKFKKKSMGDFIRYRKRYFKTNANTLKSFKTGDKVKIVGALVDFYFFDLVTGVVIAVNDKNLYPIKVTFDEPRHYEDGWIMTEWNFRPDDLTRMM